MIDSVASFVQTARQAAMSLRRVPSFTATVVATIALGVGAATTMFSFIKGALLEPLPYPEQDRLVELVHEAPELGLDDLGASPAIYFTYRDHAGTFDAVGLWDWDDSPVTIIVDGEPESVASTEVTPEVLPMLGAHPVRGRGFTEADALPGAAPTLMLSHDYWQRRFGGADVVGRTLVVQGVPRVVIGVLPPTFTFFDYDADVFYPLELDRAAAVFPSFDGRGIARLKPGVTLDEANADTARLVPALWQEFGRPGTSFDSAGFRPRIIALKDSVIGSLDATLWLLTGTIGLLLAIGLANVASLVLVRAEQRREEAAIRAALGARHFDIARLVIAETAVLCVAGAGLGLAGAHFALPRLAAFFAGTLPRIATITIDAQVAAFALGIGAAAAAVIAVPAMLRLGATKLSGALHLGAGAMTGSKSAERTRYALVVAQVALALVLLVGCGLMVRTFLALSNVDPGFRDPDGVLTFRLTIPDPGGNQTPQQIVQTQRSIVERLLAVPGVEHAAFATFNDALPLDGDNRGARVAIEASRGSDTERTVEVQFVSPGFFEALGTPLLAGRGLAWSDIEASNRVVLVSESLARAEWGAPDAAIGRRVRSSGDWEVVGVLKDVHHDGLERPAPEAVVFPLITADGVPGIRTATFVVRSARVGMPGFLDEIRATVREAGNDLAPADPRSLGDLYRRSTARTSIALSLLAAAAATALLLGLIGIYGIMSYSVALRRREIGIRLALGGSPAAIRRRLVSHALTLTAIGMTLGAAIAAALGHVAASQLFGVDPLDRTTYAVVAAVLLIAAAIAAYLPARHASTIRPGDVLKAE